MAPILYVGVQMTEIIVSLAATTVIATTGIATATYYEQVVLPRQEAKLRESQARVELLEMFQQYDRDMGLIPVYKGN